VHPITVRVMKFEAPEPEDFHPLCIAGNSVLSYTHTAMGLFVALAEPFFVKSLRRVLDQVADPALKEDTDRFCRQEAQHYQRHVDFNKIVLAHGYPDLDPPIERLKREFEGFLAHESDRFRVGYMEGFESFTTQFALAVIGSGLYDHKRTVRSFGDLFKWHMVEEIEHRNVAFDLYENLYGDQLYRARMCWFAQSHMIRFMNSCADIMSAADVPRYGERCRITARQKFRLSTGRFAMRARTMLPGYTPHRYVLPQSIAQLSAHFTGLAESTR